MAIYLDYAATTPVDTRVAEKMIAYLTTDGVFGNPASSSHQFGRDASRAIEEARDNVARLIGANPKEIIWTSGATESNNLAIKGCALFNQKKGKHIITSKTEHKAVLDTCAFLAREGFEISYIDPDKNGVITADAVRSLLRDNTILVSVMYVNNETGIINEIDKIGQLTRERGIVFHVDAAQATGKLPINVQRSNIDIMSLTAHKIYGPKGIGALFICRKPRVRLQAQIHGGGHERGFRSGTLPTHQIVGMGEAYRIAKEELEKGTIHTQQLSQRLWDGIKLLPVSINGANAPRVENVLNVRFDNVGSVETGMLVQALEEQGLAVSAGSACISASFEPSYVLTAMGFDREQAANSIRFSFGRMTTTQEVDEAIRIISDAVHQLQK